MDSSQYVFSLKMRLYNVAQCRAYAQHSVQILLIIIQCYSYFNPVLIISYLPFIVFFSQKFSNYSTHGNHWIMLFIKRIWFRDNPLKILQYLCTLYCLCLENFVPRLSGNCLLSFIQLLTQMSYPPRSLLTPIYFVTSYLIFCLVFWW